MSYTHFCTLFFCDLLQFGFTNFTVTDRVNTQKSEQRKLLNPCGPLDAGDFAIQFKLSFHTHDFHQLMRALCDGIEVCCGNQPFNMLELWNIKNAERPGVSEEMLKVQPGRDSYERKDFYNCQGIAAFYILKFRKIMQDAGILHKDSE